MGKEWMDWEHRTSRVSFGGSQSVCRGQPITNFIWPALTFMSQRTSSWESEEQGVKAGGTTIFGSPLKLVTKTALDRQRAINAKSCRKTLMSFFNMYSTLWCSEFGKRAKNMSRQILDARYHLQIYTGLQTWVIVSRISSARRLDMFQTIRNPLIPYELAGANKHEDRES